MAGSNDMTVTVLKGLDVTLENFQEALAARGFGILSEIDVQKVLRAKLDADHEPHRILGVCAPAYGKQVLDHDRDLATLLPCTVSVRERDGGTEIRAQDPLMLFGGLAGDAAVTALEEVLTEAREGLQAALDDVAQR